MDRHKYLTIYKWTSRGVICDNFDKLYKYHMNINICQLCNIKFNKDIKNQRRCLDHDHATGLYRQTICHKCNLQFDRKKQNNNKLGYKNICFDKSRNRYKYHKSINGKTTQKYFKTLSEALCFKYIQNLKHQSKLT